MGKFFREFDDKAEGSSMIVLLLGTLMFGGMAWLVNRVANGSPLESIQQLIEMIAR